MLALLVRASNRISTLPPVLSKRRDSILGAAQYVYFVSEISVLVALYEMAKLTVAFPPNVVHDTHVYGGGITTNTEYSCLLVTS